MSLASLFPNLFGKGTTKPPSTSSVLANYDLGSVESIKQVQARLTELRLLDPPADGKWGGTSTWALGELVGRTYHAGDALPSTTIQTLRNSKPLLIIPGSDFLGRVVKVMLAKGIFICAHHGAKNIVTAEGHDVDGKRNDDKRNEFNDAKLVFHIGSGGQPVLDDVFEATSTPGTYWSKYPMREEGAFNIAPGYQKAWSPGEYHGRALRQVGVLKGYRDHDRKGIRDLRYPVEGDDFGVHHHQGYDLPKRDMKRGSAGCQVIRLTARQERFMGLVLDDVRFKANHSYVFAATVLEQKDIPEA